MALGRLDDADVLPAEAEQMIEDLRFFHAPAEVIAAHIEALGPAVQDEAFLVHPVNVPAVRLFLAMQTQWREAATMAGVFRRGLDYGALKDTAELAGLAPIEPDDFTRLRILEVEALNAWAEQRR